MIKNVCILILMLLLIGTWSSRVSSDGARKAVQLLTKAMSEKFKERLEACEQSHSAARKQTSEQVTSQTVTPSAQAQPEDVYDEPVSGAGNDVAVAQDREPVVERELSGGQARRNCSPEDIQRILREASGYLRRTQTKGVTPPAHDLRGPQRVPMARSAIREKVLRFARLVGVDPRLALAVAKAESNFDPNAVSKKGALGVMQVMPATAELFGVSRQELFHPDINIQTGILYLKEMMELFPHDRRLAVAAYNCGPTRILENGGRIPNIAETRTYVQRVYDFYNET